MCISRTFIKAKTDGDFLILTLIDSKDEESGVRAIGKTKEHYPIDEFVSDRVMYEFFEGFIANTEWEWIDAEEIGALTSAPILGIRDEKGHVLEAYGYMEYVMKSILEDFFNEGLAVLRKGQ
jgi:hypothetical protein